MDHGQTTSGVYTVYPDDVTPVSVYCDQDTGGGGWVVFQRRQDSSQDFDLSLQSYKDGFGDMSAEFWFGLDKMRMFTTRWTHNLRVEMGSSRSNAKSAVYSNFNIDSDYRLNYDTFTGGDAGDCLQYQKGYAFSTPPQDATGMCAPLYYGGWWYPNSCKHCNLNARYGATDGGGIKWQPNEGAFHSHSWTEMKIRPA
ncbi:ryncolin-1-like [Littorina saxatilis]